MLVDFSPVRKGEISLYKFAQGFSVADLRAATHASIDLMLSIVKDLTDEEVTFIPYDPDADDPYAPEEERYLGWSVAHIIAHVTASSEENAAYASILARGIPYPREPRLRIETPWRQITTKAQVVQRLEESRRIRIGYLDTFPDTPRLDVYREMSERFIAKYGPQNAPAALLNGLLHESAHYDQLREAARQAREAALTATVEAASIAATQTTAQVIPKLTTAATAD